MRYRQRYDINFTVRAMCERVTGAAATAPGVALSCAVAMELATALHHSTQRPSFVVEVPTKGCGG